MQPEKPPIPFDELVSKNLEDNSFLNKKMRQDLVRNFSKFVTFGGVTVGTLIIAVNLITPKQNDSFFQINSPSATIISSSITTDLYQSKNHDFKIHLNYVKSSNPSLTSMAFIDKTIIVNTTFHKEEIVNLKTFKNLISSPNQETYEQFSQEVLALENK